MRRIRQLDHGEPFPPSSAALDYPNGLLAAGGVADATLDSLEKLVSGVAEASSTERRRDDGAAEAGSSAARAVASRARLLAAVGECDPKAREWVRGSGSAADRLDALAGTCEGSDVLRPAAAAARDAAARLRRRG